MPAMEQGEVGDGILRLRDGRTLGFAEYGTPDGKPLFFFHGTPGSRTLARLFDELARRRGVRLIAPDRPGFGRSDFHPTRTFADWPDDVAELADALHIERFAVVGFSGGGPYAAACAWKLQGRLTGVAIISGVGTELLRAERGALSRVSRALISVARRFKPLGRLTKRVVTYAVPRMPDRILVGFLGRMPKPDREILERPEVEATLAEDLREAFRAGADGAAHELELLTSPWDFDPAEVSMPVFLWHGEADESVLAESGRMLAAQIPDCRPVFIEHAGHFAIVDLMDEVTETLFPSDRA